MMYSQQTVSPERVRRSAGHWPTSVLATTLVVVFPVAAMYAVQPSGSDRSSGLSVVGAAVLSLIAASIGAALWKRCKSSRDLVFADLMLWGRVRRWRTDRRIADTAAILGDCVQAAGNERAELFEMLSDTLEARDPFTHRHSQRVARHVEAIAREMGLPREAVAKIRLAGAIHDVGKVDTPRAILNKPGKLTTEEFDEIKRHPVDGARMVAALGDPGLTAIVRHHHERIDGNGYPDGLAGAEIPLGSRIIAVADTFDAMTSTRAYRAGCTHKTALETLRSVSGSQLDPEATGAFFRYYSGRRSIAWWSVIAAGPPRLISSLFGSLSAAAPPIFKTAAIATAAAVVGGSSIGPAGRAPGSAAASTTGVVRPDRTLHGIGGDTREASMSKLNHRAKTRRRASGDPIAEAGGDATKASADQQSTAAVAPAEYNTSGNGSGSGSGDATGDGSRGGLRLPQTPAPPPLPDLPPVPSPPTPTPPVNVNKPETPAVVPEVPVPLPGRGPGGQ
ncbi:MAG: HD-GYP domain-containing protein [Solirubrobacterales bacterium]